MLWWLVDSLNPFEGVDPNNLYPDLRRLSENVYKNVRPATREVQEELPTYLHKPTTPKKTYSQDWPSYYAACRTEKLMFFRILKDAVDSMDLPEQQAAIGRPTACFKCVIKALCIKAYSNLPSWRVESELRMARSMGVIDCVYRKSCVSKYLNSKRTSWALQELFKIIAEPVALLESQYAVDSTGFSNFYKASKWIEVKLEPRAYKNYSKLHVLAGTLSNVVVAARVSEGKAGDSPFLEPLLKDAKRFKIKELSADAAYLSRKNVDLVEEAGGTAYIMPKKNVKAWNLGSGGGWGRMIWMWRKHQMLFATHYHRRSNVESVFGMIKRKWGDFSRCKLPGAIENELLSRLVVHNAVVLSEAMLSNDARPLFMEG